MKVKYPKAIEVRKRGGRAEARGASARIQASDMADRIIRNMDRRPRKPQPPTKEEIKQMLGQAYIAYENHPDSVAAKRRFEALANIYTAMCRA